MAALEAVMDCVQKFAVSKELSAILTFDEEGVSGHRDHKACCSAVKTLLLSGRTPRVSHYGFLR
eukprot:GSA25T00000224001.1